MTPDPRRDTGAPPESFEAFCELVERRKADLPRRLTEVAAFLMAHPAEVAFDPVAKIAARSGLSASAMVRLAQSVGFDGFSQLQMLFQHRLLALDAVAGVAAAPTGDVLHTTVRAAERSIRRLDSQIDRLMLARAAALLGAAHTVYLVAARDVGHTALWLGHTFSAAGIRNMPIGGGFGMAEEALGFATRQDAALLVDISPYDGEMARYLRLLGDRGVPLVLITDSRMHPAVEQGSVWLEIVDDQSAGMSGFAGLLCLSFAIAAAVKPLRSKLSEPVAAVSRMPGHLN